VIGKRYNVDYNAYCRAVIEKILQTLPIEMRNGLSFATAPNQKGLEDVLVGFESLNEPIKIRDNSYAHPKRIFLHNDSYRSLLNDYYLSDDDEKIISACVKNPKLPQDFYEACVQKGIIDCRGSISKQLDNKNFQKIFLSYMDYVQGEGTQGEPR